MPLITDLKQQLSELVTFKFISSAFTEASAVKLKNIRAEFDRNRSFYEEISKVYHLVKISAIRNKVNLPTSSATGTGSSILSVAVTSNLRFYGALNMNIMQKFVAASEKSNSVLMVIGSTGVDYLKAIGFQKPYEAILFKSDNPAPEEINEFMTKTLKFQQVILYYPKFFSLLSQVVGVVDITYISEPENASEEEFVECIFEPELAKILQFFESQVRALLFMRVMLETELARTAARLMAMSAAEERTDTMIREQKQELARMMRSITNAQLLETFAGISKWRQ
jgi:ATP synthase F1 gamma subunit